MAQTYEFQVSLPVTDTLARNRVMNALHFEHVSGGVVDADLEGFASDLVALYQAKYNDAASEVLCKVYDVDAAPNYPRASVVVNAGTPWTHNMPREIALCLSYCGDYAGNRSERGRAYLMPGLNLTLPAMTMRPTQSHLDWALSWYAESNESFPDLGGVDWKFGVWSHKLQKFTQSQQAWVNDDWDIQRRRGLRESTRVTVTREG